jgi:hypothetical protein
MSEMSAQLDALTTMTTAQLCERYQELFGEPVRTRHKAYLIRKVAWRMQELAEGGLSERAKRRAAELANDADVRLMPPKASATAPPLTASRVLPVPAQSNQIDPRLPAPGTAIVRPYKVRTLRVIVQPEGRTWCRPVLLPLQ